MAAILSARSPDDYWAAHQKSGTRNVIRGALFTRRLRAQLISQAAAEPGHPRAASAIAPNCPGPHTRGWRTCDPHTCSIWCAVRPCVVRWTPLRFRPHTPCRGGGAFARGSSRGVTPTAAVQVRRPQSRVCYPGGPSAKLQSDATQAIMAFSGIVNPISGQRRRVSAIRRRSAPARSGF